LSAIEIIAAVAVVAVVAGSSKDDDDGDSEDDENTNDFITDLGSSNNDGITSSNMITINDLKAGETWQYSIDSGVNFIDGEGNSFMLSDDTYAANVIQIKKLDEAGVTLSVTNVNETSSIVIDTTKSEFTRDRLLVPDRYKSCTGSIPRMIDYQSMTDTSRTLSRYLVCTTCICQGLIVYHTRYRPSTRLVSVMD
jgi:hypothetical protein